MKNFLNLKKPVTNVVFFGCIVKPGKEIVRMTTTSACRIFFKILFVLLINTGMGTWAFAQQGTVQTIAMPAQLTPFIGQYISSGGVVSTITAQNIPQLPAGQFTAYIYGKIQCVAPVPFTITIDTNFAGETNSKVLVNGMNTLQPTDMANAFAGFSPSNLIVSPGAPEIYQNGIIKLPDGTYNICFFAKYAAASEQFLDLTNPSLGCSNNFVIACTPINGAIVNTIITQPVNSLIDQTISGGGITSTLQFNALTGCGNSFAKLYGKIERLSPSFTLTLNPDYIPPQTISLRPGNQIQLSVPQQRGAFANFDETKLVANGIDLASITDINGRVKLPDGTYNICYYATYFDSISGALGGSASNPNLGCGTFVINCAPANGVQINTIVRPPVNPVISQLLSSGTVSASLQINNQPLCNTQVKLFGKIQRISPSPFSISLRPEYQQQAPILLNPGTPVQLSIGQQFNAFGKFDDNNLIAEGIDLASIKDVNNNIKLPDGNYRVCFYARYVNQDGTLGGNASDPNLGCGTFTVCYQAGGAPQFTQPVSNLDINSDISVVQPASPLIFTWTPPQSACGLPPGGFTYDFEIRELFANQNVTDALNNPFVFRKIGLPSTTFILDTNLNKNVLHEGQRYAIRVRAVSINTNSPVEIDNNGYSRVEAFQYGGNILTHNGFHYEPEDYYIPFIERKSDFWDEVYSSYRKRGRSDTLVPIKEYIAFALTQNLTAYNIDGIELFLAMNPELAELKKVKISYTPKLPEFPVMPANDQNNFDKEHETNLEPDKFEENKFLKYLDTLNNLKQKIPANAAAMISDLASHLNSIKTEIDSIDRVSVNLINMVLSELLYELHKSSQGLNKTQLNQLQGLVSTLRNLTAPSSNSTSLFYRFPGDKQSSLSSYRSNRGGHTQKISLVNNSVQITDDSPDRVLSTVMKQLLPFDVIVYRYKGTPAQPLLDAPDLSKTYRVFYALQNLYNHKNPEVNASSTTHLASTVQVSLPANNIFTFWTLNMLTHKNTKPEDVDLKDVLSHTNKVLPGLKKPSIVLKVE